MARPKTFNIKIDKLKELYLKNGKKTQEIAKIFGCSIETVCRALRENGIETRRRKDYNKYPCDDSFFEKINTQEKAYFLGFMYADGNISNQSKTNVRLTLQEKDRHILEKFKELLKYECPLNFVKSKRKNHQNCWTLYLCNRKIKNDLIKLGCVPAKSLILKFPTHEQVPHHLIHHFIRGYFDGDGCISLPGASTFSILSTKHVAENINKIIDINTSIGTKTLELHPNRINRQYRISGVKQIKKVYDFLYKDATIFLQRKYDKFQKLFKKEDL